MSTNQEITPDAIVKYSSQAEAKAKEIIAQRKAVDPDYNGGAIVAYEEFDGVIGDPNTPGPTV